MRRPAFNFKCFLLMVSFLGLLQGPMSLWARNFVVHTDLEPDDRLAFHVLAYYLGEDRLGLVGTTLMHSEKKRVLTTRTLRDIGLLDVPVLRGTGGQKEDYAPIASSIAAREYEGEGADILTKEELAELNAAPRDGEPFRKAFEAYLENHTDVEVIIMSAPTDIVAVLQRRSDLLKKIKTIHVMGGWAVGADGKLTSTFNWNMGHLETALLLKLSGQVRMRLYSSHLIKAAFNGGSVSRKNMPELMRALEFARSHLRGLQDLELASRHWDEGIIKKIPTLREKIGVENIGKQFTPADVALILSLFREELFESQVRFAGIALETGMVDEQGGFVVQLNESSPFPVEIVEALDIKFFEKEMIRILKWLPSVVESRLREYRFKDQVLTEEEVRARLTDQKLKPVFVTHLGQNINFIKAELSKLDPEKDLIVVDAARTYAPEFARLARRQRFKVVGLSTASSLTEVSGFSHYDDFFKVPTVDVVSGILHSGGTRQLDLSEPMTEEIYISFHTKGQSLIQIERTLSAIKRKHPHATLVHGFLPESQIHYLPEDIKQIVKQTLELLKKYFPHQVHMRDAYVGLGDTRHEMATRAARNQSPVYIVGDISGGVAEEAFMYLKEGAHPVSLGLGEADLKLGKPMTFAHACVQNLLDLVP